MANGGWQRVLEQLRAHASGQTDAQLLDAFVTRGEQAAFECLVWRHSAMVLGVCRRLLGNEADAEDAFQATFVVLLQKAPTLRPPVVLGAWLHQVARNVARKARDARQRRQLKEAAYVLPVRTTDADLAEVVDVELQRLPWKYRVPVLLCELEGRPLAPTAQELGWPQGTLASRLARGKEMLAKRLRQRGLAPALLAPVVVSERLLAQTLTTSMAPTPLLLELAQGVLPMTTIPRWLLGAAALLVVSVLGVGFALSGTPKEAPPKDTPPMKQATPITTEQGPPPREVPDKVAVLGRWRLRPQDSKLPKDAPPYTMFEFIQQEHEGLLIASTAELAKVDWYSWKLDETAKTVDLPARVDGHSIPNLGRYTFQGAFLTLELNVPLTYNGNPGKHERPAVGAAKVRYVLEREAITWGDITDKIQFGLATEPHGQTTVNAAALTFHIYVRNTSNDGVDIDIKRTDGNPRGWMGTVTDAKGNTHAIPGPVAIPGAPVPSTMLKTRLTSYGVMHVGDATIMFVNPQGPPLKITEGIVRVPPGTVAVQYHTHIGKDVRSTGKLFLTLK